MRRPQNKFHNNWQSGKIRLRQLFFVVILVGFGVALVNRQAIVDSIELHNYTPPTRVAQIATQDTLTDYARRVFYVNEPAIIPKAAFTKSCPNNGGEQSIVLGCYKSNQNGIFLLSVTDARLNGVEQVTAAHEMLHAAYDRLSRSDRSKVDAMLTDYYDNKLQDARIKKTIDAYKISEPNDIVNEMHSIFATEIADLPDELEEYYKRYFTNRAAVTGFAAQYQSEFSSREAAVDKADAQLKALKEQIDSLEASAKDQIAAIQSQREQLTRLRDSGSINSYNSAIPAYNRAIDSYNAQIDQVQALVDRYNQLVADRNAIAFEQDQLNSELNANEVAPIEKQ